MLDTKQRVKRPTRLPVAFAFSTVSTGPSTNDRQAPSNLTRRVHICPWLIALSASWWILILMALTAFAAPALAQGTITTVAGNGERGFWGNGGRATNTPLNLRPFTGGVAVDAASTLYIADTDSHRVYRITPSGQRLTLAGSDCWVCAPEEQLAGDPRAGFSGDGGFAINALLNSPSGVAVDSVGNVYIVDTGNQRIRKVNVNSIITTVAGNGVAGYSGDGGPATSASLHLNRYTGNCAVDRMGNLYIPDTVNQRIRKVGTDGNITTVASVNLPYSVAVDAVGAIYIGGEDGVIVKVAAIGTRTIVAGGGAITTEVLDVVPALQAWLAVPAGVAVDQVGTIYIADSHNQRIRRVGSDGTMITVAGSGQPDYIDTEGIVPGGFSGDGGPAQQARLNFPWGVAVDTAGNIYIADSINNRIRKVSASFPTTTNSIDDAKFFIRQHYLDFLDREPDQGGWEYWTNEITQCGSSGYCVHNQRIAVSAAFFIENEFQETGYFVDRLYQASFGHHPTFAEFITDRAQVVAGPNLEGGKQDLAAGWVERAAFKDSYPSTMSSDEFVNKLFDTANLRPYVTERRRLAMDMRNGKSRATVLREIIEIAEFKISQYHGAFVLMQYFGYLRRDPEQGGYAFWLNVLNNEEPNNYLGMVCAFVTSAEYQLRFGFAVTRNNRDCGQ